MSNISDKYVESLLEVEKIRIVEDFWKFEKEGGIGDSMLRFHSEKLCAKLGMDSAKITMAMLFLAESCQKYFTKKYFQILNITENLPLESQE